MRRILIASFVVSSIFGASAANAATKNANLNISASVVDSCAVNNATMAFGVIDPTVGNVLPGSATISVTCNLLTSFAVGLGNGGNVSSGQRRLQRASSGEYLNYELYQDALYANRFGDTVTAERVSNQLGLGLLPNLIPVYGKIPGSQQASAGSYTDVVQITIYY